MTVIANQVACPHCGAANRAGAAFCESCGKALPISSGGPRIVGSDALATTGAGQELQSQELQKQARKASGALLALAILMTIVACVLGALTASNAQAFAQMQIKVILIGQIVLAAVFWALWVWSRKQPLPAAIVGLVLYGTLLTVNVITNVAAMRTADSEAPGPRGGLGN